MGFCDCVKGGVSCVLTLKKSTLNRFSRWKSIPFIFHFTRYTLKKLAAFSMNESFQKNCVFFFQNKHSTHEINFTISPKNSLWHECLPFYAALTFMCYYSNDFSSACDMHNLWWCCVVKYRQFFINFPFDIAAILGALWYLCFTCAIIYGSPEKIILYNNERFSPSRFHRHSMDL